MEKEIELSLEGKLSVVSDILYEMFEGVEHGEDYINLLLRDIRIKMVKLGLQKECCPYHTYYGSIAEADDCCFCPMDDIDYEICANCKTSANRTR